MKTHTIQGLMYDLSELREAKLTNQRMDTIISLEFSVLDSARKARERVIKSALETLQSEREPVRVIQYFYRGSTHIDPFAGNGLEQDIRAFETWQARR